MPTITKVRLVSRSQQMIRADFEAQFDIDADQVVKEMNSVPEYDSVVLSDYDKGLFSDPSSIIENARKRGRPVLVDPKFKPFSAYQGATVVKPNTLELKNAVGDWSSEAEMLKKCRSLMANIGCGTMLVTRASEGMTLIERQEQVTLLSRCSQPRWHQDKH